MRNPYHKPILRGCVKFNHDFYDNLSHNLMYISSTFQFFVLLYKHVNQIIHVVSPLLYCEYILNQKESWSSYWCLIFYIMHDEYSIISAYGTILRNMV